MPRLAIHFARFGPYHLARINAAQQVLQPLGWEVIGLEVGGEDETYQWNAEKNETSWQRVTVFPKEAADSVPTTRLREGVAACLGELQADAVAIAGWGSPDARACLAWCRKNKVRAFVMSETRAADGVRVWWKERLKGLLIRRFAGALVGGKSHRDYLVSLGLPKERIQLGYNVVDNAYFAKQTQDWKNQDASLALRPYFLASNRFIDRKNLDSLIGAYSRYVAENKNRNLDRPTWDLCLLGDGELREDLIAQCEALGLSMEFCAPWELKTENLELKAPSVFFPGFRQIDELPRFYAHAACLVHPALEEPWGLVINEAMASGLPILSGANVGAAEELIREGENGWTFSADSEESITKALLRMTGLSIQERNNLGERSREILEEVCPTDAFGKGLARLLEQNK